MTTEIHGHHANPMPKNQKAPAFLSAVRASLHTLANAACRRRDPTDVVATGCASRRAVTVPSSEQLHRAGQGLQTDRAVVSGLWETLGVLVRVRLEDWASVVVAEQERRPGVRPADLAAAADETVPNSTDGNIKCFGEAAEVRGSTLPPPIPCPAECCRWLRHWGYRRPAFYGWYLWQSSSSVALLESSSEAIASATAEEAREVLLALGWVAARSDALGVARHLAWAQHPLRELMCHLLSEVHPTPLSPFLFAVRPGSPLSTLVRTGRSMAVANAAADAQARFNGTSSRSPMLAAAAALLLPPRQIAPSDEELEAGPVSSAAQLLEGAHRRLECACRMLLLRFGRLKHALRLLRQLEVDRALQLQDIDLFQRSQRGVLRGKVGVRAHRGNDGSGSGGNGGGGDGTSGISASTMLLLARPEKQQIMEACLEHGSSSVERLLASGTLEPAFWKWLTGVTIADHRTCFNSAAPPPFFSVLLTPLKKRDSSRTLSSCGQQLAQDNSLRSGDESVFGSSRTGANEPRSAASVQRLVSQTGGFAASALTSALFQRRLAVKTAAERWRDVLKKVQHSRTYASHGQDVLTLLEAGGTCNLQSLIPLSSHDRMGDATPSILTTVKIASSLISSSLNDASFNACTISGGNTVFGDLTVVRRDVDDNLLPLQEQLYRLLLHIRRQHSQTPKYVALWGSASFTAENTDDPTPMQRPFRHKKMLRTVTVPPICGSMHKTSSHDREYVDIAVLRKSVAAASNPQRLVVHRRILRGTIDLISPQFPPDVTMISVATSRRIKRTIRIGGVSKCIAQQWHCHEAGDKAAVSQVHGRGRVAQTKQVDFE
jgi:hypothetical protein